MLTCLLYPRLSFNVGRSENTSRNELMDRLGVIGSSYLKKIFLWAKLVIVTAMSRS